MPTSQEQSTQTANFASVFDMLKSSDALCQELQTVALADDYSTIVDFLIVEDVSTDEEIIICQYVILSDNNYVDGVKSSISSSGEISVEIFTLDDWNCDYLLPKILYFNKDSIVQDRTDVEILKIYDSEELRKSNDKLLCGGFARTSRFESYIEYSIERDKDGDLFHGYSFVDNLSRQTEEDEELVEQFFICLTEDQEFREALAGTDFEGLLHFRDLNVFREAVFGYWNSEPGVTDTAIRESFTEFVQFCPE